MNNERRKQITKIIEEVSKIQSRIMAIAADEEYYRDNIPENLQGGERYDKADCAVDALGDAVYDLDTVLGDLNTSIE